jgi:hypothetical protein
MAGKITDIQTLLDRQAASDAELSASVLEVQETHPEVYLPDVYPSIRSWESNVLCDALPDGSVPDPTVVLTDVESLALEGLRCGCATIMRFDAEHHKLVPCCVKVIYALKAQSLVSCHPYHVRLFGKLKLSHEGMPQQMVQSSSMTQREASRQIGAGLMETRVIAGEPGEVLVIHDLVHAADKHCKGCRRWEHPGCWSRANRTGIDLCPDLVEVPGTSRTSTPPASNAAVRPE